MQIPGSRLRGPAQYWHVTEAERRAGYPCDAYAVPGSIRALRAVDVVAPVPVTFRWLCQIKVAPYSYDWIDNRGRRSPRTLTRGADQLRLGDSFLVGTLVDFERDRHVTIRSNATADALFGPTAITYLVQPGATGSRLIVCLAVGSSGAAGLVGRELLLWGDLIMMRRQLLNLKECAEAAAAVLLEPGLAATRGDDSTGTPASNV